MTGVLYTWINSGTICAKNIAGKRLERMLVIMNDIQLELLWRGWSVSRPPAGVHGIKGAAFYFDTAAIEAKIAFSGLRCRTLRGCNAAMPLQPCRKALSYRL
jgi:hypothetical protein